MPSLSPFLKKEICTAVTIGEAFPYWKIDAIDKNNPDHIAEPSRKSPPWITMWFQLHWHDLYSQTACWEAIEHQSKQHVILVDCISWLGSIESSLENPDVPDNSMKARIRVDGELHAQMARQNEWRWRHSHTCMCSTNRTNSYSDDTLERKVEYPS